MTAVSTFETKSLLQKPWSLAMAKLAYNTTNHKFLLNFKTIMKVSLLLNYDAKPGPSNVNKPKLDYRLYQPVELLFVCSLCHRHMIWLYAYDLYNKPCIKPGSFILCIDYFRWSLPKTCVTQSQMSSLFFMVDRELRWWCLMIMLIGTRYVAW